MMDILFPGEKRRPETFAERLRRLREERGFSKVEVAKRVGLTEGAIRQLESGRTKDPRFTEGVKLAELFRVTPHYLALGDGLPPPSRPDMDRRMKEVERRLGIIPPPP